MPPALALQAGITDLSVSLTHEGDIAAAVVVALCRTQVDASGQSGVELDSQDAGKDD